MCSLFNTDAATAMHAFHWRVFRLYLSLVKEICTILSVALLLTIKSGCVLEGDRTCSLLSEMNDKL